MVNIMMVKLLGQNWQYNGCVIKYKEVTMSNNDDGALWSAIIGLIAIVIILCMAFNFGLL